MTTAVAAAEGEEVPNQTRLGTTRWVVAEEAAVAAAETSPLLVMWRCFLLLERSRGETFPFAETIPVTDL